MLKSFVIALGLVLFISCSNGQTQNGNDSGNTTNNNPDDKNTGNNDDKNKPLDFDAKTKGLTVYQSSDGNIFVACIPEGFIIKRIEKPGYNAHIRIHVSSPNSQKTLITADLKPNEYVYIYKFTEKNHYYDIKVEVFKEDWSQAVLGNVNNLKAIGGVGEWYISSIQLSFSQKQKNVLFNCSFHTPDVVIDSIKSKETYLGIWPRGYANAGSDQFSINEPEILTSIDISNDYNKVKNTTAAVEWQYVYNLKDDTAYLFSYYGNYNF